MNKRQFEFKHKAITCTIPESLPSDLTYINQNLYEPREHLHQPVFNTIYYEVNLPSEKLCRKTSVDPLAYIIVCDMRTIKQKSRLVKSRSAEQFTALVSLPKQLCELYHCSTTHVSYKLYRRGLIGHIT